MAFEKIEKYDEKTTKEIAGEMNMTDGQVRVRLHRIRRRIRKGMKDDA